ncbi:MAG: RNA 3'-terminal phosphate cyclase [Methanomicrobiaceae archaeon]|nr:RNA 3'-terminal phosphate cyclase [Methanomicrobiaceae archaeon]
MRCIDGARLEGGGQLVRTAVALAALNGEEIRVEHVRQNRAKPGLSYQHIAAVRAAAALCDAECEGVEPGSRSFTFSPGPVRKTDAIVNVGTAGSIPLVLQAWLPAALSVGGTIIVSGGTEVRSSPSIDYVDHLFCALLRELGAEISITIERRGYYPEGGGEVAVRVAPWRGKEITLPERKRDACGIVSCAQNLPDHVPRRQASSAGALLPFKECPVTIDEREGISTGTSCTVWHGWKGGIGLGRPGYPAERVGRDAAETLLSELRLPGDADRHLADQLIVLSSRYGGSFSATASTPHARTMQWLCGELGAKVDITERDDGSVEVSA